MGKLFPPFLEQGSSGVAVDVLHALLCSLGFGEGIVRDCDYGPATTKAVKDLQVFLGFEGNDVDGKFGPATRARLKDKHSLDVDLIPWSQEFDEGDTFVCADGTFEWDGKNSIPVDDTEEAEKEEA